MSTLRIKPFHAVHPCGGDAPNVASVPYDVVNREEAAAIACENEDSFIRVVRSEIDLPSVCPYDETVYIQARKNYDRLKEIGALIKDKEAGLYLYRQIMGDHKQVGLVACCHVDDYNTGLIKKHEKTRQAKEDDRTKHVIALDANSGPVFLTYKGTDAIDALVDEEINKRPMFHFVASDGVTHTGWKIENENAFLHAFEEIPVAYVADGHHRSASAARAAVECKNANPNHNSSEEYNWFLTVLFPTTQLDILPYNRIVVDLNGKTTESFLEELKTIGTVTPCKQATPDKQGTFCVYLGEQSGWHRIDISPNTIDSNDPIASLDVDLLQQRILVPMLGVGDPRSDTRIDFVGGIRGTKELENRVNNGSAAVAFSMYPTTIEQLLAVADADLIMPPKSTWFEPKLRSGLFSHDLS
jgi:uncharacterized protein (DUF1015 family)